ncbi:uncharacterized protein LOC123542203 [Mercenaria mercenaria]|uniref:uncharacterized protein LOC123542203 n=1 Tax=Mercenaria mercenaria TaxID=6596 RepID=UPI00234E3D7D|nr:uncharacterized protein LOC123542203 [Mercenaria mercenaria]
MVDNDATNTQLWDALNNGETGEVVTLLRGNVVDIDYRDVTHDLQTFLMRVCYVNIETEELLDILEAIFDHSPDVNIKDSWGRTVLMHACIANKPVIIEGLLEYEYTDVGLVDFEGNSVLSFAVQNCDVFTLEDILQHRSGPKLLSIHNFKGQSPYTIAQKSGDKTVIKLFDSYLNKTIGLEKKKKRKPRNRDVIKLPPTYSPSPERSARRPSPKHEVQYNSNVQCNYERLHSTRNELKLDIDATKSILTSENDVRDKCESAPVLRGERICRDEVVSSLSLSSPKLARRHHKQDCLLQETLLLNQSRNFPQVKSENKLTSKTENKLDLPEYSLRKQRRPSISLPDLRSVSGFLVNSGSSTPTTEGGDISKRSTPTKDDDNVSDDDDDDDVFSRSCPSSRLKSKPIFKRQISERQVILPDINKGNTTLSSSANFSKGITSRTRQRKYSNSDDQLNRTLLKN